MGMTSASAARTPARMTKNASLVSSIDATLDPSVAPFISPNVAPAPGSVSHIARLFTAALSGRLAGWRPRTRADASAEDSNRRASGAVDSVCRPTPDTCCR